MFSDKGSCRIKPYFCRSAGMWPTPASVIWRTGLLVKSWPLMTTWPPSTWRRPVMASTSSSWPLPSIPARPRISPPRILKERPLTASVPRSSLTCRSLTSRIFLPRLRGALSSLKLTWWPTIISANCSSFASATLTVWMDLPARMTVTRSALSLISFSLWVIKMMDLPSLARFFMILMNSVISCGVKTAVGSSKIKMSAPR